MRAAAFHLLGVGSSSATSALVWAGLLVGLVVCAGVLILILRRRVFAREAMGTTPALSFADLRAMRERGEIGEEEFEALRAAMVRQLSGENRAGGAATGAGKAAGAASASESERRAAPGFDLAGDPLPGSGAGGSDQASPGPPAVGGNGGPERDGT